jgi:hypothetical protein
VSSIIIVPFSGSIETYFLLKTTTPTNELVLLKEYLNTDCRSIVGLVDLMDEV